MLTLRRFCIATTVVLSGAAYAASAGEAREHSGSELVSGSPISQIAEQLSGTWMTTEPIETRTNEDGSELQISMVMSVAPVSIEGMENTLYAESARSNELWAPFRQSIFQLYEYKGKVRLRTFHIAQGEDYLGMLIGMSALPAHFPPMNRDSLIATLDVELDMNSSGFSGSTPYPYPTGVMGAVEMTSSMTFDGTTLTTSDRGYDADGNIVWGAGQDAAYKFERIDPFTTTTVKENGLVILDYTGTISDTVVQEGDEMHVHYSGYLTNGALFDSSYNRGQPFIFVYPPKTRAIVGWGDGMEDFSLNGRRKLIIPSDIGYGPGGNPRANIPGDSTLIFNAFLPHISNPVPVTEEGTDGGSGAVDPHAGHNHGED